MKFFKKFIFLKVFIGAAEFNIPKIFLNIFLSHFIYKNKNLKILYKISIIPVYITHPVCIKI